MMKKMLALCLVFLCFGITGCSVKDFDSSFNKYEDFNDVTMFSTLTVTEMRTAVAKMDYPKDATSIRYEFLMSRYDKESVYLDFHYQMKKNIISLGSVSRDETYGTHMVYIKDGYYYSKSIRESGTTYEYKDLQEIVELIDPQTFTGVLANEFEPRHFVPMEGDAKDQVELLYGGKDIRGNLVIDCTWKTGTVSRLVLNKNHHVVYILIVSSFLALEVKVDYTSSNVTYPMELESWQYRVTPTSE